MRLCLKYSLEEEGCFLSHLDLMRLMERAFRRANLPLAFSEGFNPHPRVSFASALAVGVTSEGEYLDVQLRENIPIQEVQKRLNMALPSGIKILESIAITKRKDSLMALINMARYRVAISLVELVSQKEVDFIISRVISQTSYCVFRRSKRGERQVDIRPGLFRLEGTVKDDKLYLEMDVQAGSQGNVKPTEVVKMQRELSPAILGDNLNIHRLGLYILNNNEIKNPLEIS
ncbi:MAG: TIGR03936 family radical SAM-associated protein [Clostridia bacterium]|nr:TIGR03936 family radical SAM-associated protein [Clostridia bacterium]